MMKPMLVILCATVFGAVPVAADGPPKLQDLPQYTCMTLTLTPEQARDVTIKVPLYAAPSRSSPILAYANMLMAVRDPQHPTNGFDEVLFTTGRTMWIEADALVPYRNLTYPQTRCVPARMPNGLISFDLTSP